MPERTRSLTEAVDELTKEARLLNGRLRQRTRWFVVILVVIILTGGSVIAIGWQAIEANNRKWCETLSILTAERPPPGSPERTVRIDRALRGLADTFHCDIHSR